MESYTAVGNWVFIDYWTVGRVGRIGRVGRVGKVGRVGR